MNILITTKLSTFASIIDRIQRLLYSVITA